MEGIMNLEEAYDSGNYIQGVFKQKLFYETCFFDFYVLYLNKVHFLKSEYI